MDGRLSAHLEAAAIRRIAESQGGFATVLARGEKDAGTIGLVIMCRGKRPQLYERMPDPSGNRLFMCTLSQDTEKAGEFSDYLRKRREGDPDFWLIEADVPDIERFVAALPR